jgi:hypothetical protein
MLIRSAPSLAALCLSCLALAPLAHGSEEGARDGKRPGFLSRTLDTLNPFNDGGDKRQARGDAKAKDLALAMTLEPQPLKLSEAREMRVTLQLTNKSRRFVQLEFPTSQRVEVLVRNKTGRLVEQWSEDQRFTGEPTVVTINPGERLEYTATVATRDLAAGQTYTVEGFFPNFEALRTQKTLVPEK